MTDAIDGGPTPKGGSRADTGQLVSYIALSAPATRRPASGDEAFLRPEIGFTPNWFHSRLGIEFGEPWHRDPSVRRDSIHIMAREIRASFPGSPIGVWQNSDRPTDLLTGTFGSGFVAALYGIPICYSVDDWPWSRKCPLTAEQVGKLQPPDLDSVRVFQELLAQVEWITKENGRVEGFLNWQGVLNNAYRIRGQEIFLDLMLEPERARHLFACIAETMIDGARRLYEIQHRSGVMVEHFTVSNCLVNMISPEQYREFIFPLDRKIAEAFGSFGVHNCAWNATPYVEHYKELPKVGYVDMGLDSDLGRAREAFPSARRAVMYTPMDVKKKTLGEIRSDLERVAEYLGPCDVVFADIEAGTPDERVLDLLRMCDEISRAKGAGRDQSWERDAG